MTTICFATNNINKLKEARQIVAPLENIEIIGLADIGCKEEIPENEPTIEGNSMAKAHYVFDKYKISCFADDTGLEVSALNGEPGVLSARYAGEHKNSNDNIDLLLKNLLSKTDRSAQFKTIVSFIDGSTKMKFEGIVKGEITIERQGEAGFGYDPIFMPSGASRTFSEMSQEDKNTISHRGIAIQKMINFFKSHYRR